MIVLTLVVRPTRAPFLPMLVVAGLLLACATSRGAPVSDALGQAVDQLIDVPDLRGGISACVVERRDTGAVVFERNSDIRLMPASTRKLFTTAAVLGILGDDFTISTAVVVSTPPTSGNVDGDLYLRGGGDSLLSPNDLDAIASAVAAAGVHHIHGSVIGDGSVFEDGPYGDTWGWDTLTDDYAPVIAGLEVNDGVVSIHIDGGAKAGDPTTVAYDPPYDEALVDNVTTGDAASTANVDVTRPWRSSGLTLTGAVPPGAHTVIKVPVIDPVLFAAQILRSSLIRAGVAVDGPAKTGLTPSGGTVLAPHTSPPMTAYIAAMNKPSDNLLAESLVRIVGLKSAGHGTYAAGDKAEMAFFAQQGIDTTPITLEDGSGVSRRDYITARTMAQLLTLMSKRKDFDAFYNSLPIAGVDGTLKRRSDSESLGNLHAKTGTLTGVCALAGYFAGKSGTEYDFAILMNNYSAKAAQVRSIQDAIVDRFIDSL